MKSEDARNLAKKFYKKVKEDIRNNAMMHNDPNPNDFVIVVTNDPPALEEFAGASLPDFCRANGLQFEQCIEMYPAFRDEVVHNMNDIGMKYVHKLGVEPSPRFLLEVEKAYDDEVRDMRKSGIHETDPKAYYSMLHNIGELDHFRSKQAERRKVR